MKKAVTLIELIFTIVIIGAVFTTIPKIIYVSNKSLEFSKKEDAIFNMMAKMMDISLKEYDENNTKDDSEGGSDILLSGNDLYLDCNSSTGYRVGGFKSGRNCKNGLLESDIGDDGDTVYDDIDDYNGTSEPVENYRIEYNLSIGVGYTNEWNESYYTNDGNFSFDFNNISNYTPHTNIKRIHIEVLNDKNETISSVNYYSANIGHAQIKHKPWE